MIVYAWKQFWNDFNNGDEALFQDANRPRDNDKFKLQAGIQARKQDLRTANSGIAAQGTFHCYKSQAGQSNLTFNTAYMKNTYTTSDFWGNLTEEETKRMNADIIWKPYVNATNWDIVIGKDGVYAITIQCMFIAPSWYSVSSSYNYKFYVALMLNWNPDTWTQSRGCWTNDALSLAFTWIFRAWDRVNVWFLHTYTTNPFTVVPEINLYRLS